MTDSSTADRFGWAYERFIWLILTQPDITGPAAWRQALSEERQAHEARKSAAEALRGKGTPQ